MKEEREKHNKINKCNSEYNLWLRMGSGIWKHAFSLSVVSTGDRYLIIITTGMGLGIVWTEGTILDTKIFMVVEQIERIKSTDIVLLLVYFSYSYIYLLLTYTLV